MLQYGNFEINCGVLSFITKDPQQQESASKWLVERRNDVEDQIVHTLGINAFRYVMYSTGSYGFAKYDGITLTFDSILSGEDAYCTFNADIKYQRGAKTGKKLPKKRFKAKPRSKLLKFLDECGLKPRRPSEYHEHMGKLKELIYVAEFQNSSASGKLLKDSIKPLNLNAKELTTLLLNTEKEALNRSAIDRQYFGNCSANARQHSSASTWLNPSNTVPSGEIKVRAESITDIRDRKSVV